jgi:hypothetical protein
MITYPNGLAKALEAPLLKIRDVASLLSISRQSVRALLESDELKAHELNLSRKKKKRTHVRITRKSLAAFYYKRFGQELDVALQHPLSR